VFYPASGREQADTLARVVRRILWASLALAPATLAIHYLADPGDTADFILAAISLIPLAWLIGEATEHAAAHTGAGIGGFLNATFGNAPELVIALIAVNAGKFDVVRASLMGSIVGNLLLVLGFSLLFGPAATIDRRSSFSSLGLVAVAVALALIPSIPAFSGNPERHSIARLSIAPAVILLVLYVAVTWRNLRRHRQEHVSDDPPEAAHWSLGVALAVLGAATLVTALIAEILVQSIDTFAANAGLSDFFVAAVIVAIVGNAAEHGGAVVVAHRGNIRLAAEIALASAAQVGVFLIPAVALLAWALEPLALSFRPFELTAIAGSVALTAALLAQGRSDKWRGAVLVAAYAGFAVAALTAGDR
jgi:Ca2+:H+ antiporter